MRIDAKLRVGVIFLWSCAVYAQRPQAHPPVSTAQPNVRVLPAMTIPVLDRQRVIRLYLPPGYATSRRRYAVLYMHDGQNLFDAATSYAGEWGVDETLNSLAASQGLELIVVGIDNGADKRTTELSAWDHPKYGKGEGREYMRFVVDVVKPYIDRTYRTLPDRQHTAIMGSSLGGLISHYAIYQYPEVFGKAGIFSPAYWYAPLIFDFTATRRLPSDARLYFYAGGREGAEMLPQLDRMLALIGAGPQPPSHISVKINPDAQHNEAAWRAQFAEAVIWLFAPNQ